MCLVKTRPVEAIPKSRQIVSTRQERDEMSVVGGITICQQNKEHNFTINNFEILFFIFNAIPFHVVFCLFNLLLAECGQCSHKTVLCLFRSFYSISCHYMSLWSIYYLLLLEVYSNTALYNFFQYYQPFNVITYKSFYLLKNI